MEKINIICVDDQREVLSALRQDLTALENWITLEECQSAYEALDLMDDLKARHEHIAVVISDHAMPGKTGIDLLGEVARDSRFKMTRKILLTGQATHADTIQAINEAGIDRYIEKPWNRKVLLESVRSLATEYIFECGLPTGEWHHQLDQKIVLARLR